MSEWKCHAGMVTYGEVSAQRESLLITTIETLRAEERDPVARFKLYAVWSMFLLLIAYQLKFLKLYLLAQLEPGWPSVDLRVDLCGMYSLHCSIFFFYKYTGSIVGPRQRPRWLRMYCIAQWENTEYCFPWFIFWDVFFCAYGCRMERFFGKNVLLASPQMFFKCGSQFSIAFTWLSKIKLILSSGHRVLPYQAENWS